MSAPICNIPGYKVCPACKGDGERETGYRESSTGYAVTATCPDCDGEGTVVDEDAVCESCLAAGKVREYDVLTEYGERFCYDCADAGNGKVNEQ